MRVDEDARMKRMQVKRARARNVVLSRDEASVAKGGTDVLYVIREVNGRVKGWMGGWMGKVRLGGGGEEGVVGLRGGQRHLQLQEAEVTRERQLRYDAPLENIPIIEAQRPKGPKVSQDLPHYPDQFTALHLRIRSVEGSSPGCTRPLILNPAEQHQHQHQPCASPIEVFLEAAAFHSSTALPSSAATP